MNIDDLARRASAEVKDQIASLRRPLPPKPWASRRRTWAVAALGVVALALLASLGLRSDDGVQVAASNGTRPAQVGLPQKPSRDRTSPPSEWEQLRGQQFTNNPNLPPGAVDSGGGPLGDVNADPLYGWRQALRGNTLATLFLVSVDKHASSVTWRVLDVDTIEVGDHWLTSDSCNVDGQLDRSIVGVVLSPTAEDWQEPSYAWRLNTSDQAAEALGVSNISCRIPAP
jgi:hypothetical protein